MYDEHTPGQHLKHALDSFSGLHTINYHRVGQPVHRCAVADATIRLNDVRLGRCKIDLAIANQDPADAQHVDSFWIQARGLNIHANQFSIGEQGSGRRNRVLNKGTEYGVVGSPESSPTSQCQPELVHEIWKRLRSAAWLTRTCANADFRFCLASGDISPGDR